MGPKSIMIFNAIIMIVFKVILFQVLLTAVSTLLGDQVFNC
jgi:hypothetical protein